MQAFRPRTQVLLRLIARPLARDLRLVRLHGLWPDIRVCTLSGQLFWGMATQTADSADNLSDNPDDLLRHAPPVYNSVLDPRSQLGRSAKRVFDVACLRTPACEPKPKRALTIPFPVEAAVCQIAALYERGVPFPTTPKPDAPPQGEGGTERPLARCPLSQRRNEVSEARGPSLYVGDSSFQAWFPQEKLTEHIMMLEQVWPILRFSHFKA